MRIIRPLAGSLAYATSTPALDGATIGRTAGWMAFLGNARLFVAVVPAAATPGVRVGVPPVRPAAEPVMAVGTAARIPTVYTPVAGPLTRARPAPRLESACRAASTTGAVELNGMAVVVCAPYVKVNVPPVAPPAIVTVWMLLAGVPTTCEGMNCDSNTSKPATRRTLPPAIAAALFASLLNWK